MLSRVKKLIGECKTAKLVPVTKKNPEIHANLYPCKMQGDPTALLGTTSTTATTTTTTTTTTNY